MILSRHLVASTCLLILICVLNYSCKTATISNSPDQLSVYIGTSTNLETEGIYIYTFDQSTGKSKYKSTQTGILNPGYLTISADSKTLYAAHSVASDRTGQVSAFRITPSDELQFLNRQSTGGNGVCYISTDPISGDILAANYGSGSTALIPVLQDGSLAQLSSLIQGKGSSINPERQKGPHAHFAQVGPGGLVYAADLGTDQINLYKKYGTQLSVNDPAYIKSDLGAGPRHIEFHPNQKFIYLLNEMGGSVTAFSFNQSQSAFTKMQTISSVGEGFTGFNKSADIHIHPSSRFLYASNRGDSNSIAVYTIDENTGLLSLTEIEDEGVAWPRNFTISPNGLFLLCANRDDDSITVYKIDQQTGALTLTGDKLKAPKPICVKFKY